MTCFYSFQMCPYLGEKPYWLEPDLEQPGGNRTFTKLAGREHAAMCYDKEESRLIVFGGWANKWLDDIWQINVSIAFQLTGVGWADG